MWADKTREKYKGILGRFLSWQESQGLVPGREEGKEGKEEDKEKGIYITSGIGRYLRMLASTISGEALMTNARGLLRLLGNNLSKKKKGDIQAVLPIWRRKANMRHPPKRKAANAIRLQTLKTLLRKARRKRITRSERRALDIFLIAFVTMSRTKEITALRVKDVLEGGTAIDVRTKTMAKTWLKLRKKVSNAKGLRARETLEHYKRVAIKRGKKGLFWNKNNKPVGTPQVSWQLKRVAAKVGYKERISAHSARKGAAVEAVLAGIPLPVVQALGAWKDINSLQAYIGDALRGTMPWLDAIGTRRGQGRYKEEEERNNNARW